jgi:hypothetical protein
LKSTNLCLKVVRLQLRKAYFATPLSGGMQFLDSTAWFTVASSLAAMLGWGYLIYRLNWGLDGLVSKLVDSFMHKMTYSGMGKASGETRFRASVEKKTQEAMIDFLPKVMNNPVLEMGIEYILNETELGDLVRDDPRALPIALGYLNKMVKEGINIEQLMAGLGVGGTAEQKTGYE